ncbi:PAS domain S-box protein [Candidatus Latescibacterota bacterium]
MLDSNTNKTKEQLISEVEALQKKLKKCEVLSGARKNESAEDHNYNMFESISSNLNAIILVGDPNEIQFVRGQTEKILGYSVDDWTCDPEGAMEFWYKNLHPDDRENARKQFKESIAIGNNHALEYRMIAGDRRIVWFYDTVNVEVKEDGRTQVISVMVDITERKKAENALKKSEEKFKNIVMINPDVIYQLDKEGIIKLISPRVEELLGYKTNELVGKNISEIICEEDLDKFGRIAEKRTGARSTIGLEVRLKGKKRIKYVEMKWVGINSTGIYDNGYVGDGKKTSRGEKKGEFIGTQGTITDITERKKSEEALKKSRDEYLAITNLTGEIIVHVNKDSIWTFINDGACEFFGKPRKELIGTSFKEYLHPADLGKTKDFIREMIDSRKIMKGHVNRQKSKDGWKKVEWNVYPHFDKSGMYSGLQATGRDITERLKFEAEQAKASKLESIGILAGGIAHDFNNILAAILGNASLAKISSDNKNELFELLTEVEKASIRATKLTQQLLTFSKGGAPVKETTDLSLMVKETVEFTLRGSNVGYKIAFDNDLWHANIDKGQISQVIGNLTINAKQAMPKGGTITIYAKNESVSAKSNLPLEEGIYVKISMVDEGLGIAEENLSKIFDPYYTSKRKGTGLGLATTYSIIKRHDGNISVESEQGEGATFHFYLPASKKTENKKDMQMDDTMTIPGKILIMDDEEIVRNFISKMLLSFGNEVVLAMDGEEMLEIYKEAMDSGEPFDAVIMDLTIPSGMGGKEAIKELLKIDPNAKALVSSGYSSNPVISNCEKFGFKGFIPKPYRLEDLKCVLHEVLTGENELAAKYDIF